LRGRILRLALVAALTVSPLLLLRIPQVRAALASYVEFLRTAGVVGVGAYFASYLGGVVVILPVWLLSGVAGYAYGFVIGAAIALPVLTAAACIVFGLARRLFKTKSDDRLARVVRAALEENEGSALRLTILVRIAPIMPQNAVTYVLAATPLRARDFALGTFVGLLPATLLHTYGGSLVKDAAALVSGEATGDTTLRWVGLGGGLLAVAVAMIVITRAARRALARLESR
jgi:uncharacterized membrane protein YdjX (TVP38/TMEM64 family)